MRSIMLHRIRIRWQRRTPLLLLLALMTAAAAQTAAPAASTRSLRVEVTFPGNLRATPLNGRLYLMVSTDLSGEPRFQIGDGYDTQQFFGITVEHWQPGQTAVFDASALGYPRKSLRDIAPGDYTVQALLNVYTTFHLANGRVLQLPKDEGEGQQWNQKPGNLYSRPQLVHIGPGGVIHIQLSQTIPPLPAVHDTAWIRHVHIQSRLLTHFWGQPTEPWRDCAAALRLGTASAGALSAHRLPGALPARLRRAGRRSAIIPPIRRPPAATASTRITATAFTGPGRRASCRT